MGKPTRAERIYYPLLAARPDWPPPREAASDMDPATRAELTRYWDDMRTEEIARERAQAADPAIKQEEKPWYEQARDRAQAETAAKERSPAPAREAWVKREPEPENLFARYDKQMAEYEADLVHRAMSTWFYTREEREIIQMVKHASPDVRRYYHNRIIQERMDKLREKDRQAYWESIQPKVEPSLRDRVEGLFRRGRDDDDREREAKHDR